MTDPVYHEEDNDVVVQESNPVPALLIGIVVIVALLIVLWAAGFNRATNVTNIQPGASAGGGAGASLTLPSVAPSLPAGSPGSS